LLGSRRLLSGPVSHIDDLKIHLIYGGILRGTLEAAIDHVMDLDLLGLCGDPACELSSDGLAAIEKDRVASCLVVACYTGGNASIEARSSRSPDVHVHVQCTLLVVHDRYRDSKTSHATSATHFQPVPDGNRSRETLL
jgi:hypothetical protein